MISGEVIAQNDMSFCRNVSQNFTSNAYKTELAFSVPKNIFLFN